MEIEPLYQLTVVDADEFRLLSQLPDYTRAGNSLTRLEGNLMQVVMLDAEFEQMERCRREVEAEIAQGTAQAEFQELLEKPISPPAEAKPAIPPRDAIAAVRFHGPPPERPSNDRPKDRLGGTTDFSPLF
jgi:hypothetical protein